MSERKPATITRDSVDGLMETVRNLYLADDIPWVIGYSGGKDSTATVQLVWLALRGLRKEQLHKAVHVINTDTLVESPVIAHWVQKSLSIMSRAAGAEGLPFVTHRLTPAVNNTFWVNFLGRGYPFPRKKLRWCTDRLLLNPASRNTARLSWCSAPEKPRASVGLGRWNITRKGASVSC